VCFYNEVLVKGYDSVFTAVYDKYFHWWESDVNHEWYGMHFDRDVVRQPRQINKYVIQETGSIYITTAYNWLTYNRFGANPHPYVIPTHMGMELDEPWQIPLFEALLKEMKSYGNRQITRLPSHTT